MCKLKLNTVLFYSFTSNLLRFFFDVMNKSNTGNNSLSSISSPYNLIIRLEESSFSVAVRQQEEQPHYTYNTIYVDENATLLEEIQQWVFDSLLPSTQPDNVCVQVVSSNYTLVPSSWQLSSSQVWKNHLQIATTQQVQHPLFEELHTHSTSIIFDIGEEIHSFLCRHLQHPQFTHHICSLFQIANKDATSKGDESKLWVYIRSSAIDLLVIKNGELSLIQPHPISTEQNISYKILQLFQHFELNPYRDEIVIVGESDFSSKVLQICQQFVQHISLREYAAESLLP